MNCFRLTFLLAGLAAAAGPLWAAGENDQYEWQVDKWVRMTPPGKGTPAAELSLIRKDVRERDGREAAKDAKEFLKKYHGDPAEEEVLFLSSTAEMLKDRYFQAYEILETKLLTSYPSGRFLEKSLDRMYEIAEAFLQGKKRLVWNFIRLPAKDDALEILARIAEHAPGTDIADKSLMRIADYRYSAQEYLEAVRAYDQYMSLFGKGPRASYAMLQAAKSCFNAYRGFEFDDSPLLDARERYRTFMDVFPQQAAQAHVGKSLEQIRLLMAQKVFATAVFYERVHHTPAAIKYYHEVERQYPHTTWQEQASAALMRLNIENPSSRPAASQPSF